MTADITSRLAALGAAILALAEAAISRWRRGGGACHAPTPSGWSGGSTSSGDSAPIPREA